jgi:hypothetical protein
MDGSSRKKADVPGKVDTLLCQTLHKTLIAIAKDPEIEHVYFWVSIILPILVLLLKGK